MTSRGLNFGRTCLFGAAFGITSYTAYSTIHRIQRTQRYNQNIEYERARFEWRERTSELLKRLCDSLWGEAQLPIVIEDKRWKLMGFEKYRDDEDSVGTEGEGSEGSGKGVK